MDAGADRRPAELDRRRHACLIRYGEEGDDPTAAALPAVRQLESPGDDALAPCPSRYGHGADLREGAARRDGEGVDGAGRAGLHVEVAAVGGEGRVDRAGAG